MIKRIRIVLGWVCAGAATVALWQQTAIWLMIIPFIAALLLHGGFWRIRRVVQPNEEQRMQELLLCVIAALAFLIGAFTNRSWLCWLSLGTVLTFGIVRDIRLLGHVRNTELSASPNAAPSNKGRLH